MIEKSEISASSWLKTHNFLRMHGQQNIKKEKQVFKWKWSGSFRKMRENSWLAEKLSASQEGPSSIKSPCMTQLTLSVFMLMPYQESQTLQLL
jgi:hypothetical protein